MKHNLFKRYSIERLELLTMLGSFLTSVVVLILFRSHHIQDLPQWLFKTLLFLLIVTTGLMLIVLYRLTRRFALMTRNSETARFFELYGLILPKRARKFYDPAVNDILQIFALRRRYRTKWARRWINFVIVFKTAILLGQSIWLWFIEPVLAIVERFNRPKF